MPFGRHTRQFICTFGCRCEFVSVSLGQHLWLDGWFIGRVQVRLAISVFYAYGYVKKNKNLDYLNDYSQEAMIKNKLVAV